MELPVEFASRHGFGASEEAVFVRLDSGVYRDGLRFANGVELSLQQIPAGVSMELIPVEIVPLPTPQAAEAKTEKLPELV